MFSPKGNIIVGVENADGSDMAKLWRDLWLLPPEVQCVGAGVTYKACRVRNVKCVLAKDTMHGEA